MVANTAAIKIGLLLRVDLINPGCDVDLDPPIRYRNVAAAILVHANAETSADVFYDGLAHFNFELVSSIFMDVCDKFMRTPSVYSTLSLKRSRPLLTHTKR